MLHATARRHVSTNDAPADKLADLAAPGLPDDAHWRELIAQVGSDVAACLTPAMERVNALATSGQIDRASLARLREEIERARHVGLIGQQLARFASGRVKQTPEALNLTQMLREAITQRSREAATRGLEFSQSLKPTEVIADPSLLYTLVQALLDWAVECALERVEFRLDLSPWPQHARLSCRFAHRTAEPRLMFEGGFAANDAPPTEALEGLEWRLLRQLAHLLSIRLQRSEAEGFTVLTLEFVHTVLQDVIDGLSAIEPERELGTSTNSKPLAGTHVLVIASRREVRSLVRDAVRHMGLLLDFVPTVLEAEQFCRSSLPHAVVYESALSGERLETFRNGIQAEVPSFVFVEITEDGHGFQLSNKAEGQHARVGRDGLLESLPSALIFELSNAG